MDDLGDQELVIVPQRRHELPLRPEHRPAGRRRTRPGPPAPAGTPARSRPGCSRAPRGGAQPALLLLDRPSTPHRSAGAPPRGRHGTRCARARPRGRRRAPARSGRRDRAPRDGQGAAPPSCASVSRKSRPQPRWWAARFRTAGGSSRGGVAQKTRLTFPAFVLTREPCGRSASSRTRWPRSRCTPTTTPSPPPLPRCRSRTMRPGSTSSSARARAGRDRAPLARRRASTSARSCR